VSAQRRVVGLGVLFEDLDQSSGRDATLPLDVANDRLTTDSRAEILGRIILDPVPNAARPGLRRNSLGRPDSSRGIIAEAGDESLARRALPSGAGGGGRCKLNRAGRGPDVLVLEPRD